MLVHRWCTVGAPMVHRWCTVVHREKYERERDDASECCNGRRIVLRRHHSCIPWVRFFLGAALICGLLWVDVPIDV